ncbi:GIGYF family protein Gyf [Lutzomyia longipalpis]|uniref:GIGYF family protein Gyf n=1 Tax=Lutzomyia longipalpis TaxID=7200 RepID=UPI002483B5D9|nr:GIGYF family protein Gyf [Lutzomyia longipalpis]
MTDSMKFGPEWLRNMSNDTGTGTGTTSQRHQLAEFRYGREEMLSLFDKNIKVPEILPKFKNLFVEKIQCPLALTPSTEDDLRVWQVRSSPGLGLSSRGARGGLIDRGRGRGRSSYHSLGGYQRSTSLYDEEGRIIGRGERWPERNGTESSDWNGLSSTSPRKDYNSHGRGGSQENWRRSRLEDETSEGWRSTSIPGSREKWTRSTSWREEEPGEISSSLRGYNSDRGFAGGTRMIPTTGRKFWDQEDNLPEWAMENPLESGGSFDATGAFHGSDDELGGGKGAGGENDKDGPPGKGRRVISRASSSFSGSDNNEADSEKSGNDENVNSLPVKDESEEKELKAPPNIPPVEEKKVNSVEKRAIEDGIRCENPRKSPNATVSQEKVATVIVTTSTTIIASSIVTTTEARAPSGDMPQNQQMKKEIVEIASVDRMQEVADDMVEKLIMEDELVASMGVPGAGASLVASVRNKMHSPMVKEPQPQAPHAPPPMPMNQETESNLIWFYRDPQDMVQGPFTAIEMAEWYQAGYFDDNLCVRRMGDQRFSKLGELIELCGGEMPFFAPYRILPQQMNEAPVAPVNLIDDPSVSMNFQMLRQHYLVRQQALVYQKLCTSDFWHMLTADQQREMINKQVALMGVPDNIYALLAAMPMDSVPHSHPMGLQELMGGPGGPFGASAQAKMLQMHHQTSKMINSAHPAQPGGAPLHPMGPFGGGPHVPGPSFPPQVTANMNIGNLVQQQQQPPPPQMGAPTMGHRMPIVPQMQAVQQKNDQQSQNDRIKSLILQLSMQKGMPQGQETNNTSQWGSMPPPQEDFLAAQKQPPWMGGGGGGGNGGQVEAQPRGMWDLGATPPMQPGQPPQMPSNIEMKTEKQILEEQQQQQQQQQQLARAKMNEEKRENFYEVHQPPAEPHKFQEMKIQDVPKVEKSGKKEEKIPPNTAKKVEEKAVKSQQQQLPQEEKPVRGGKKAPEPKNQPQASKPKDEEKKREEDKRRNQKRQHEEEKRKPSVQEEKKEVQQEVVKRGAGQSKNLQGQTVGKNKTSKSSVAPWLNSDVAAPGMSLAEIQKAEMEHRAEQSRYEQLLREQQQQQQRLVDMQTAKESVLPKWNAQSLGVPVVKSLAEIQAEEQAKAERERELAAAAAAQSNSMAPKGSGKREEASSLALGSIWNNTAQSLTWNSGKLWGGTSNSGFWEEPTKPSTSFATAAAAGGAPAAQKALAKSQTMTNIQTAKTTTPATSQAPKQNAKPVKPSSSNAKSQQPSGPTKNAGASGKATRKDDGGTEFTAWCMKALTAMNSTVDIPTFVSFLQDIESPYEVKDYIRMYLGETKECTEFAKQFLERRSKYKNQIRAQNAHVDDMCSPAPAITPSTDCQEVKGKGKKIKKNKMMKLDSRILGFSVTAAQDRINVGDRDYPNAS